MCKVYDAAGSGAGVLASERIGGFGTGQEPPCWRIMDLVSGSDIEPPRASW